MSIKRLLPLLLALPIAAGAVAAGCGGGGGDSSKASAGHTFSVEASTTVTAAPFTKAQFIARANRICRRAWVEIRHTYVREASRLDPRKSRTDRLAEAIRFTYLASIDFDIFDDIRALGAPRSQKRRVEEVLGSMQEAVERGQRVVRVHSSAELLELFGKFNRRARAYGLHACIVPEPPRVRFSRASARS